MTFDYQSKANPHTNKRGATQTIESNTGNIQLKGNGYAEQKRALSPANSGYEAGAASLRPADRSVQFKAVQFQDPATKPAPETNTEGGVEICTRVADIPGNQLVGGEHWWIRTPNMERGMGPATGGVPGRESSPDLPFTPTTINDHTGQGDDPASKCVPAGQFRARWKNVDQASVEKACPLGKQTGRWVLGLNDCHTWVEQTMDKCRPQSEIDAERRRRQEEADRWDGIGSAAWGGA